MWRLVLGVLVASGLVLAFGGVALRRQRKQLELQRELAVAEAQRARDEELLDAERVATMGTFAMGIAHEVATPLGVIVGRAEQLLGRGARATSAQPAARRRSSSRRIASSTSSGDSSTWLGAARRRSSASIPPSIVARGGRRGRAPVRARPGSRWPPTSRPTMPTVQCDRDLLEQAIVNLLLNACEACDRRGARRDRGPLRRRASRIRRHRRRRRHQPRERRAGDRAVLHHQGRGAREPGLGLAIATEIVKSHRGELTIAPNPDKGTRALIEIPISTRRRPCSSSSDPVRVLVVDDRVEMAEMIADDLCDRGYEGLAVSSGSEALHILQTKRVDAARHGPAHARRRRTPFCSRASLRSRSVAARHPDDGVQHARHGDGGVARWGLPVPDEAVPARRPRSAPGEALRNQLD